MWLDLLLRTLVYPGYLYYLTLPRYVDPGGPYCVYGTDPVLTVRLLALPLQNPERARLAFWVVCWRLSCRRGLLIPPSVPSLSPSCHISLPRSPTLRRNSTQQRRLAYSAFPSSVSLLAQLGAAKHTQSAGKDKPSCRARPAAGHPLPRIQQQPAGTWERCSSAAGSTLVSKPRAATSARRLSPESR